MKETTKKKILPPKVGTALKSNTPIKPPKVVKQAGEPVSEEFVQDSSDSEDTGPPKDKSEKAKGKKPALKPTRIEPQSKPHPKPQSKPLRKLNEQSEKTSRQNKPVNGVVDVPRVPLPPKAKSSPPETTRAVPSDSGSSDKGEEEQSDSASDSAGGKDTGSDSEDSESGVEESDATAGKTAVRTVEENLANARNQTIQLRPAPVFVPPPNFKAVSAHPAASSNVTKLFNQSSVSGKEIWHITVPAGVPIDSIKELAFSKITSGEAIVNTKGTDYGFKTRRKGEEGIAKLLIPGPGGYTAVPGPITRSLDLQQVIQLPKLSSAQADQNKGSAAAASSKAPSIKAPRPQPKGLRMRFLPSGFGTAEPGNIGSSDSEAEVTVPKITNGPHRPKKRKHHETNGDNHDRASPIKKAKKSKDPEHEKRKAEKKARRKEREAAGAGA